MPRPKTFCSVADCDGPCIGQGYCRTHYKRWYRYGDPLTTKKTYRQAPECSVEDCGKSPWAKGLCQNHYALNRRHGEPVRHQVFQFSYIKDGYRYVYVSYRHYEPEHRLVMERFLGRKLTDGENVHHIDENTMNNSPSNLQLLSRAEHAAEHIKDRTRGAHGHLN